VVWVCHVIKKVLSRTPEAAKCITRVKFDMQQEVTIILILKTKVNVKNDKQMVNSGIQIMTKNTNVNTV
jgi:hypothetical protein